MKSLLLFAFMGLWALSANAVTVKVTGQDGESLFESDFEASVPSYVGDITVAAFNKGNVPYEGDISGISKIFDLEQKVDKISSNEMKAYGWCFAVDGFVPTDTMPDQTPIADQHSVIEWFYSYASFKDGVWTDMCVYGASQGLVNP